MQDLKSMIKLINRQKVKNLEILILNSEKKSKFDLLFEAIQENRVKDDESAINLIYGDEPNAKEAYKKLKYRLRQRVINTLFFIDVQGYARNPEEKATLRVIKSWAASQILRAKGQNKAARVLLEKILKTVRKYEMLRFEYLIYHDLKFKYGLFEYSKHKYEEINHAYRRIVEALELQNETRELYAELGHLVLTKRSPDKTIDALEARLQDVYPRAVLEDDYDTRFWAYNSYYFLLDFKKDLKKQNEICEEALSYFKKKEGFSRKALISFTQKKGLVLLALGKYQSALQHFDHCLSFNLRPGTLLWQAPHSYKFNIFILTRNYDEAYKTIAFILNHKAFEKVYLEFAEPWRLKEAFIHFLVSLGKIKPKELGIKPLRKFMLGRFLNEVTTYSKDKKGLNICINIIQLLFIILDGNKEKLDSKIQSIKQYSARHLKGPEFNRARTFIKMLVKIPKALYRRDLIEKKCEKLYSKLLETRGVITEQRMSLEIIPYEQMWEELLSAFEQKN